MIKKRPVNVWGTRCVRRKSRGKSLEAAMAGGQRVPNTLGGEGREQEGGHRGSAL